MRLVLALSAILITTLACGLVSSDEETIDNRICNFNVDINGKPQTFARVRS